MAGDESDISAGRQDSIKQTMASTNTTSPGVTSDAETKTAGTAPSISTTKAGILGYILGLATAGILYLVTKGKGKRSNASRNVHATAEGEPTLLPSPAPAVDAHDNDGCTAEEPVVNHHAPAGQRKLTDEDVETIRAMKDGGKPVKEIATLYGVSPKTIYARLKKNNNPENHQKTQDDCE